MVRGVLALGALLLISVTASQEASAATITYLNDEAGFLAAAPGVSLEDFESLPLSGASAIVVAPDFSVEDTGTGAFQDDIHVCIAAGFCDFLGPGNPPDGGQFLHTSGEITFTFNAPINAFSVFLMDYDRNTTINVTTDAGDNLDFAVTGGGTNPGDHFLGFVNDMATFTTVTIILSPVDGESIGVDSVRYGTLDVDVIPEPSTWLLMAAGFAGLGIIRSRRRRKEIAG